MASLLDDLVARLNAEAGLSDVRVIENVSVDPDTFQLKVRATVGIATPQIRFLRDESFTRYSFQLYGSTRLNVKKPPLCSQGQITV